MNRLTVRAVLGLAALVCLSMAEEGVTSHHREVRKTKHADKHKEPQVLESPEYQNDGYTVVAIPMTASKPTIVDSLMSMINDASKSATTVPQETSSEQPEVDERNTDNTTIAPTDVKENEPIGDLTEKRSVVESEGNVGSLVGTPTPSVYPNEFNASDLIPLVEKVSSFSLNFNNTLDAPALANVCEESKRQLVQMFNKVIGQLSELFNSMYSKMTAIATHQNPASSS